MDQKTTDLLARLDGDTTALAAVVKSLRDRITTSMTTEDVAAVQNKLDEIAGRLEATAADPGNPIPPGPPPAAMPRKK